MLYLITGGSGSGKSEYAEDLVCYLAEKDGQGTKWYLATMESESREAAARIARHREQRAGKGFVTIESPLGLPGAGGPRPAELENALTAGGILLLECISNLLANLMFGENMSGNASAGEILRQIGDVQSKFEHIVIVTNEIFSDGASRKGEMREYTKALGRINRSLADLADLCCEVVYSVAVWLKGETTWRF